MKTSYKFPNAETEECYNEAVKLLRDERERQREEIEKCREEWARLPEHIQIQKCAQLREHFHEREEPYVKLVMNWFLLASPVITIDTAPDSDDRTNTGTDSTGA